MDDKIEYSIYTLAENTSLKTIIKCYELVGGLFTPLRMKGKTLSKGKFIKYNKKVFLDGLQRELENDVSSINLTDGKNHFWIVKDVNYSNYFNITIIIDSRYVYDFEAIIDELMIEAGVIAYRCILSDDVWQNMEEITEYEYAQKSLDGIKTKERTDSFSGKIVDIEYNPGHSHRPNGIWFGSCYQMWFGKPYYQYISKEKLQSFHNCYENIELVNDVIRITLYNDIWAYEDEESRMRQWDFRRSIGIDDVAHLLEYMKDEQTISNPEVEILSEYYDDEEIRVVNYYLDGKGCYISKDKAEKVKSYGYTKTGKILFSKEKRLV